jgi:hypothetical protein
MATNATAHRLDPGTQSLVEGLAIEGRTAAQIERALADQGIRPASWPSRRTIQRIVKAARTHDSSGPWSLGDAKDGEAQIVLPVLRAYLNLTALREVREERDHFITRAEARWIVRVSRAAPELHPFDVYRLARAYLARESRAEPTYDLDALLAFTPWDETPRSNSHGVEYTMRQVYQRGVAGGTIPPAPAFFMMELADVPWSPKSKREWDLLVRARFKHEPDAYGDAALKDESEEP